MNDTVLKGTDEGGDIARAAWLARWLDGRFLDPLIGFLAPGAGDYLTALAGLYIVLVAIRRRVPVPTIARMFLNLGIDALVGAIPVLGDLFDVAFRANIRNLELLKAAQTGARPTLGDWLLVGGAGVFFLGSLALQAMVLYWLLGLLLPGGSR